MKLEGGETIALQAGYTTADGQPQLQYASSDQMLAASALNSSEQQYTLELSGARAQTGAGAAAHQLVLNPGSLVAQ